MPTEVRDECIYRLKRPERRNTLKTLQQTLRRAWKRASSCETYSSRHFWSGAFPGLRWMLSYDFRSCLQEDIIAGLTVGVMAVPQVVSFAAMAGLPAAFGLYGCLAPVVAYAVFGGSPHLAVGPVALVSLLLSESLGAIIPGADENVNPNRPENPAAQQAYNEAAIQASLIAGILFAALSTARLGFLANLMSRPLVSSFLTAGSILISLSQVKYILGYNIPRDAQLHTLLTNLAKGLPQFKWIEFVLGTSWVTVLLLIRNAGRLHRNMASLSCLGPIVIALLSTGIVWGLNLHKKRGVNIIGHIQSGLPPFTVPWWKRMHQPVQIFRTAGIAVVVSSLEAISIGKALGELHGYSIDPNTELKGLAAANLAGAAFAAYPSTGSFARSAISSSSGGRTGLNVFIVAPVVGATLYWLVPAFRFMPMNAMAAIVIVGVLGLMKPQKAMFYFKVSLLDFAVWMTTFLGFLFISIDAGLALGVGLSQVILYARHSAASCVRIPLEGGQASEAGEDSKEVLELSEEPLPERTGVPELRQSGKHSIVVIKIGCPLTSANAEDFQRQVTVLIASSKAKENIEKTASMPSIDEDQDQLLETSGHQLHEPDIDKKTDIVLDFEAVLFADATAAEILRESVEGWSTSGNCVSISGAALRLLRIFEAAGVTDAIGDRRIFWRLKDAIEALKLSE